MLRCVSPKKGGTEWAGKKHSKELKASIALDAIKGQKTNLHDKVASITGALDISLDLA
jgi:hypothetical protein